MILQIMSDTNMADDNYAKPCFIVSEVMSVKYYLMETGEAAIDVEYRVPLRELLQETFVLSGNAYLMNDNGKTIRSFYPNNPKL